MDIRIESRNFDVTDRRKAIIQEWMTHLQTGHEDITHGRVTLSKSNHHKHAPDLVEAVVVVTLPKRHTFTAKKSGRRVGDALKAAFLALEGELQKYREKRGSKKRRTKSLPL